MSKPYRILVTGSRDITRTHRIKQALKEQVDTLLAHGIWPIQLVHGGAPGADTIAGQVWAEMTADHIGKLLEADVLEAEWQKYGGTAGPMRNQAMVNSGVNICLAFPMGKSVGTRDCMRKAEAAGVLVLTFRSIENEC